jgi:hypothetical protein
MTSVVPWYFNGIEPGLAVRFVEFVPLAYGRLLLAPSGAQFSSVFQRRLPNSAISEPRPLSSEPIWDAVLSFAQAEIAKGISVEDFLAVAARSAEFQGANELLKSGSKIGGHLIYVPAAAIGMI